jgi:choline-sulfatase
MRNVICLLLLATAAIGARPNIVFILTDDQAVDTITASRVWEAPELRTPHLDRLVADGTTFANAYNMGAWHGAVCVASRSMLQTGKFLWPTRQAEATRFRELVGAGRFWSQRMKAAGYTTLMAGKWHVEAPLDTLFDQVLHPRPGMPKSVPAAYQRPHEGGEDPWDPCDESIGGFWEGGRHWSEVTADDAEALIRDAAADRDQPFFLYLAFNAPHDPRQSPREFIDLHPPASVRPPSNFLPVNPHHAAMGLGPMNGKALRDEALAPFPRSPAAIQTHRREYRAIVSHLDAQIGRVLAALQSHGLRENTVVILTSDHGLALGRHGLMGKQNLYEHSIRVPFLIAGPGIPKQRSIATRIHLQDAMATALDLAGADRSGIDFRSLLPLLRGEPGDHDGVIYAAMFPKAQRAIIEGDHKLVLYPESSTRLLFNLADDPLETRDLAGDPDQAPRMKSLFARLMEEQRKTGDPLDLKPAFPGLAP